MACSNVFASSRTTLLTLSVLQHHMLVFNVGMCRCAAKVVHLKKEAGKTFSYDELKEAIEKNKPAAVFLCQARPIASLILYF